MLRLMLAIHVAAKTEKRRNHQRERRTNKPIVSLALLPNFSKKPKEGIEQPHRLSITSKGSSIYCNTAGDYCRALVRIVCVRL